MGKLSLPMLAAFAPKDPRSVDAVRAKLGGRGASDAPTGARVRASLADGSTIDGVVLFVEGSAADVVVDATRVRRVAREALSPLEDAAAARLAGLADDVRVFATLAEGQRVRFAEPGGGTAIGLLAEKCRYGALVARDDGTIVGVGFRKVWPAAGATS